MSLQKPPLELWGGIECTLNRVGDQYFDQLKYSGHDRRPDDLNVFAETGLRTIRYPFLWERIAPRSRKCRLGLGRRTPGNPATTRVNPIAGFVHHGSGPRSTNLLDPQFGHKLAEYARAFASRYPWVQDYTPINEPLTTARFSALYGIWYPHHKDNCSFVRALVNECRATALAMREVRRFNPAARLIQTDDLGKASGTPLLEYQVAFENERAGLAGTCSAESSSWPCVMAIHAWCWDQAGRA